MSQKSNFLRAIIAMFLATSATIAQAHTGHGTEGLAVGLMHPFGIDHLLAMMTVGVWSVSVLPAQKTWQGPAVFLLVLMLSAALGRMGVTLPYLEHGIALSLVLFGLMLTTAVRPISSKIGLVLLGVAASFHGIAHGAETPSTGGTGFASYAAGFMFASAALHLGGIAVGLAIKLNLTHRAIALNGLGSVLGATGLYLFFGQLSI